jgi:hypothetical protein
MTRYSSCSFLTSTLDGVGGQRHASATLYPRKRSSSSHWIGGWVGLRAGLDTEAREQILCLYRESNHGCPVCSRHYIDWAIPASLLTKRLTTNLDGSTFQGSSPFLHPVCLLSTLGAERLNAPCSDVTAPNVSFNHDSASPSTQLATAEMLQERRYRGETGAKVMGMLPLALAL